MFFSGMNKQHFTVYTVLSCPQYAQSTRAWQVGGFSSPFEDEQTEAQRGEGTCLTSQSQEVAELGHKHVFLMPKPLLFNTMS